MHITRIKPSSSAPAGIERHLNACDQLISATDTRGVITYVNEAFVKISGYAKEELLGQHHNVVRHPDMPKGAFHNLWGTIRAGHSWRGAVKNRCKSGEYYWVDAYVSPIRDKGKIVGFQSVRTFLDVEARHRAQALYQHWREQDQEQLPG